MEGTEWEIRREERAWNFGTVLLCKTRTQQDILLIKRKVVIATTYNTNCFVPDSILYQNYFIERLLSLCIVTKDKIS